MVTISFDVSTANAQRIGAAFGKLYGLKDEDGQPRSATGPEVKQFIIAHVKAIVVQEESRTAVIALPTPADIDAS